SHNSKTTPGPDSNRNEYDITAKSGNKQTGPKTSNQEDIEITEKNNITEISNEEIQIDKEVNQQQDHNFTENEQVEKKRLYS
ncbi:41729_t:CDS:2, partial [Gigaspora margarita]